MHRQIARPFTRRALVAGAAAGLAAPALAQQLEAVSLGIVNSVTDVGFMVADKRGYFREEGLEVKFIEFDSAARMIAPMASGELNVGSGGVSAGLYNAVARGLGIKIVAGKNQTPPGRSSQKLLMRKDFLDSGRYRTLADLKGMKIANGAAGSSATALLVKILDKGGLSMKDIQEVYMNFTQQIIALENRAVDAALTAEPQATESIRRGAASILADYEIYPDHQISGVLYSADFMKNRRDAGVRFLRAFLRGVRDHEDALVDGKMIGPGADKIIDILVEYGPIKNGDVYRSFVLAQCPPNGENSIASLSEDLAIFRRLGIIEGDVSVEKAVDGSFVEAALKSIGRYVRK